MHRVHRVQAYIDQHLDQPLDLPTLAQVAYFSPFHFHRLFAAWMGETLGDYLRRRRVEVAAMRMAAQPRLSVLNAGLGVGFGSGESFSSAFKLRFGASPTTWRVRALHERTLVRKPGQEARNSSHAHGNPGQAETEEARHTGDSLNPIEIAHASHPLSHPDRPPAHHRGLPALCWPARRADFPVLANRVSPLGFHARPLGAAALRYQP